MTKAATRTLAQHRVKWIHWPQGEGGPIFPSAPPSFELLATAGHLGTFLADMWVRDSESYWRAKFNHSFPPDIFLNNNSCIPHAQNISDEIDKKDVMGAITALRWVGEVPPPCIVMPFSTEPSKPRVVHVQQYLNCFYETLSQ